MLIEMTTRTPATKPQVQVCTRIHLQHPSGLRSENVLILTQRKAA